jgi:uncharacterized protein (DUF1499 family)
MADARIATLAEWNWASIGAHLGFALAILALVLLALGPLGWHLGWWHYRFALTWLMAYPAYIGIAGAAVSLAALLFGWAHLGGRGIALAGLGILAGAGVAYEPWHYNRLRSVAPPIHDITTDTDNPPAFVAALPVRAAAKANPVTYEGANLAKQQKAAYPDIVPVKLALAPDAAFKQALDTAKGMSGWTVVDSDAGSGRIEANQASRWFHFVDDVVIRVSADGAGSKIDIRSVSRVGRSDFGVNAERVRAYMAAVMARAG